MLGTDPLAPIFGVPADGRIRMVAGACNAPKIVETLTVERNGKPLDDVAAEYWAEFVRDLIPPGVAQLFFFDGEKIQHLADDTSDQRELSDAMKALLGLDAVERLGADLEIYRSRVVKALRNVEGGNDVEETTQELQHLENTLGELHKVREGQETTIVDLRGQVSRVQDKITAQGGSFVRNTDFNCARIFRTFILPHLQPRRTGASTKRMCSIGLVNPTLPGHNFLHRRMRRGDSSRWDVRDRRVLPPFAHALLHPFRSIEIMRMIGEADALVVLP